MPVKDGVQEGFSDLNDLSYRISLTNLPKEMLCESTERTGLISYFEAVLSAEEAKKYKPAVKVYDWAAKKLEVGKSEILMVSSHE